MTVYQTSKKEDRTNGRLFTCPKCKQQVDSVWCSNCGEEVDVYQIIPQLTKQESELLKEILGHVNYDADESEVFSSMCKKIINL